MIELYNGDCIEVINSLLDNGIKVDCVITDVPYEILSIKYYMNKMHRNSVDEGQMAITPSNIAFFIKNYKVAESEIINYLDNFLKNKK